MLSTLPMHKELICSTSFSHFWKFCYGGMTYRNQSQTNLETPLLLASFHRVRNYYASCWRRKKFLMILELDYACWNIDQDVTVRAMVVQLLWGTSLFSDQI